MKNLITPGRLIGLTLGLILIYLTWGFVFTKGGIGSNVLLGLALSLAAVYYLTLLFGAYLDDMFFNSGNRERAFLLRHIEVRSREIKHALRQINKSSRKKSRYPQDALVAAQALLLEGEVLSTNVRSNLEVDAQGAQTQIESLKKMRSRLDSTLSALLKKPLPSGGFFASFQSLAGALSLAIVARIFLVEPYQIPSGSMIPTMLVGDHLFVSKLRYGIINPLSKEPSYLVRWSEPKPGDVVVFTAPPYVGQNSGQTWIKRVIAGPGQTVALKDSVVYVDGQPYPHIEPYEPVTYSDFAIEGQVDMFLLGSVSGQWVTLKADRTVEEIGTLKHQIYLNPVYERNAYREVNWPNAMYPRTGEGLTCNDLACRVNDGYVFVMGDNRGHSADSRFWGALKMDNIKGKALFIWMSVDGSTESIDAGPFALPAFRWSRWMSIIR